MTKGDEYRRQLQALDVWEPFLLDHSGLPGPRGNMFALMRYRRSEYTMQM